LKDFKRLQKECLDEVIAAGITPGNIVEWKINTRAKTRWGKCTKERATGNCIIEISNRLLEDDRISEKDCKTTMIHEILHSCKDCMAHTGKWKEYATIMNLKYGYNIKRVTKGEEKGVENHTSKSMPYKYRYRCSRCGQLVMKKKACKFTKYYRNYTCGICGKARAFHKF